MNKQLLDELDSYSKNYITDDSNCCLIQSDDDGLNIFDFTPKSRKTFDQPALKVIGAICFID